MNHTEPVKIKVIHLLRRLERIDRDLEELDRLKATIQEDREYAERLRDSLAEESRRLHQLRDRILVQVVLHPPDEKTWAAVDAVIPAAVAGMPPVVERSREPEVIVPRKKIPPPRATREEERKPAAKNGRNPHKSDAPFQFRYN